MAKITHIQLISRHERGTLPTMERILTRDVMWQRLLAAAEADARIVGLVDYGSSSEGRADAWSDVDASIILADDTYDRFVADWRGWAAQFGTLLLAYIGGVGHPWAVYDASPLPLRVDFDLHRAGTIAEEMGRWPNAPVSVPAMVRYDGTGGRIAVAAARLVGQSLAPPDPAATFTRVCGDFWYYTLKAYALVRRGEEWAARFVLTNYVTGNLCALLRLESGAIARWRAADAAASIEHAIAPERLAALNNCIPAPGLAGVARALGAAAVLGRASCTVTAAREGWSWPAALADRIVALFEEG